MATALKKKPAPEPVKKGSGDYLLQAFVDLDTAVRKELGRTAVRAQRTPEALTTMQAEIRDRKRKLKV